MVCVNLFDDNSVHQLAVDISKYIEKYRTVDDLERIKLIYGIECQISNISKLVIIIISSIILKMFIPMLITLVSYNIIREKAFGVHAKSKKDCFFMTMTLFVVGGKLVDLISIGTSGQLFIMLLCALLLYKYAPMDSENNPLIGPALRRKLKKEVMIRVAVIFGAMALIPDEFICMFLSYGVLVATLLVLPITYKILNREMYNYEKYE